MASKLMTFYWIQVAKLPPMTFFLCMNEIKAKFSNKWGHNSLNGGHNNQFICIEDNIRDLTKMAYFLEM